MVCKKKKKILPFKKATKTLNKTSNFVMDVAMTNVVVGTAKGLM